MIVPLVKACQDPRLLGATLTWRPKQLEMLKLFGDDNLRLVAAAAGRQGGKSSGATATGIWGCTMRDDLDALMPRGRTRYCLLASPTESQSRELIRLAASMIEASEALRSLAVVKADEIVFSLPSGAATALRALPANPRSVRGMTASLVIADECAHFNREDQTVNDVEMLRALEGSMSVFDAAGKSKAILISTPRGQSGEFYRLFTEAQSGVLSRAVAFQAPAWVLNPALDTEQWREEKRQLLGVDGFLQEHGAEFVVGGGQFFDLRGIELEEAPARPEDGRKWVAGLDPAFHADRFGVALVGESIEEKGVLLVGRVEALDPGARLLSFERRRAREDRTLQKVWDIVEPYRPSVVTDQHQADAVRSFFGRLGTSVRVVNLTASSQTAAFTSTRVRLVDGSLRLWNHPQLIEELRRVRARDSERIELPRFGGGHADAASALALAVYQHRHVTDAVSTGTAVLGRSDWMAGSSEEWLANRGRRGVAIPISLRRGAPPRRTAGRALAPIPETSSSR